MTSYQSLVLTRISDSCLIVDEPQKKLGILDEGALIKQHELPSPDGNSLRSTLVIGDYLFTGFSNGLLLRQDRDSFQTDIEITLHTHIFCIEQLDDDHIICGQMNGWVDVVRISDGEVVCSKELKHITGNVTMIARTHTKNEIMLGTQRGVYFAHVGRGLGLMEVEMERFDKKAHPGQVRMPEESEQAEVTTLGPKYNDLDGMSQMTFHT
jgi:hypothetical protein